MKNPYWLLISILSISILFMSGCEDSDTRAYEKHQSGQEKLMIDVIKEEFIDSENIDVKFDKEGKTYFIYINDEMAERDFELLEMGYLSMDTWKHYIEYFIELSEIIQYELGSGYVLHFTRPMDPDFTSLELMDGEVLYNYFRDGGMSGEPGPGH